MVNRYYMSDILNIANRNAGKIPNQIPDHYVKWVQSQLSNKNKSPLLPNVIRL